MQDGQIFNAIIAFFEGDEWNFSWIDGLPVLSMPFTGKNGKWMCYAQAREEQEQFVFYSVCPINAPQEKHAAVSEFITRANYGMIIGNFEMDYTDGEVRYKTSIDVEGERLTSPLVKQMVYANVIIMDRYIPGLMSVVYGNVSPLEAVTKIEDSGEKSRTGRSESHFKTANPNDDDNNGNGDSDDDDEQEEAVSELKENIISDIESIIKAMDNQNSSTKEDDASSDDHDEPPTEPA